MSSMLFVQIVALLAIFHVFTFAFTIAVGYFYMKFLPVITQAFMGAMGDGFDQDLDQHFAQTPDPRYYPFEN